MKTIEDKLDDLLGRQTIEEYNKGFKTMPKSYQPQVIADSSGQWSSNALRFKTEQEAYANVQNLASRWFSVREYRVVASDDEPNYRWRDGQLQEIKS